MLFYLYGKSSAQLIRDMGKRGESTHSEQKQKSVAMKTMSSAKRSIYESMCKENDVAMVVSLRSKQINADS